MNKLWFKSEGFVEHGKATDGDTEALYDRPIPFLRYFDAQAGVRYDLDSNPGRTWGAVGVEGLAPYFFRIRADLLLQRPWPLRRQDHGFIRPPDHPTA